MRRHLTYLLKKPVNYLLLLICGILLQVSQYISFPEVKEEVKIEVGEENSRYASFQYTTSHVGLVNTAENRLAHNTSPVCETDETDKRRQQNHKLFEALSTFKFTSAKNHIFNEGMNSRRQPHFFCVITENRQLRL